MLHRFPATPRRTAVIAAVVVGAVAMGVLRLLLSPSAVMAAEDVARAPAAEEPRSPLDVATLVAPDAAAEAATPVRVAIEPISSQGSADAAQPEELFGAKGILLLPASFPAGGEITVEARCAGHVPVMATVDNNLRWRVARVPAGDWLFCARAAQGERFAFGSTDLLHVDAHTQGHVHPITLQEYAVEGVVTDDTGAPIPNVLVDVSCAPQISDITIEVATLQALLAEPSTDSDFFITSGTDFSTYGSPVRQGGPTMPEVYTDSLGRFRAPIPEPGIVTVTAPHDPDDSTPTTVDGRSRYLPASDSIEVNQDQPVSWIALSATRASALAGKLASICPDDDSISVFARDLQRKQTHRATADAAGEFDFGALPFGEYRFYARHGGESSQDYCYVQSIQLLPGVTHRITATLLAASSASGVVLRVGGKPAEGVTVRATGIGNANLKRSAKTDERGVFVIDGMYGGTYNLTVNAMYRDEPYRISVPSGGALVDAGIWKATKEVKVDQSKVERQISIDLNDVPLNRANDAWRRQIQHLTSKR